MRRKLVLSLVLLWAMVASAQYKVSINSSNVDVVPFKDIHYVHVESGALNEITVACDFEVEDCVLSPLSYGVPFTKNGNTITFIANRQGYFVLTINKGKKLFVLIDKPEENPAFAQDKNVLNLDSYKLDKKGNTLVTAKLQKAISDAAKAKKTLYIPAGVYKTGTLTIGSGSKIYLAKGAVIKGSADRNDYPADDNKLEADHVNNKDQYSDNGEFMTFSRLVLIDKANNVKIWGRGMIDGSGKEVRAQGKPANLIRIRQSQNVSIDGIFLCDPAAWNTHILYSDNVAISNVKMLNDPTVPNTDGFDPDASTNVKIENCFAYCSDDNIAIKSSNNGCLLRDVSNIEVRNCVFLTRKSSLKVGTETKAQVMKNIIFDNNDVIESDRGMALYCNDGATFENITYSNNRFERNYPDSQRKAIHFTVRHRCGAGQISNVLVKNCTFVEAFPKMSEIMGLDEEHSISGITFENLAVGGKLCKSAEDANIKTKFASNIVFK